MVWYLPGSRSESVRWSSLSRWREEGEERGGWRGEDGGEGPL